MARASREQRAQNHERVLDAAARLVREKGADGVSVPEVMAAAGLTHGGFYKHFSSKEALLAEAADHAFTTRREAFAEHLEAEPETARARFLSDYLSTFHRDHPGVGCAGVALAADAARRDPADAVHGAYVAGVTQLADALHALRGADQDATASARDETRTDPEALVELAMLVGAQVLARATTGHPVSEQILDAVQDRLLERWAPGDQAQSSAGPWWCA